MKKTILFLMAAILTTGLISFERNLEAQSWGSKNKSSKVYKEKLFKTIPSLTPKKSECSPGKISVPRNWDIGSGDSGGSICVPLCGHEGQFLVRNQSYIGPAFDEEFSKESKKELENPKNWEERWECACYSAGGYQPTPDYTYVTYKDGSPLCLKLTCRDSDGRNPSVQGHVTITGEADGETYTFVFEDYCSVAREEDGRRRIYHEMICSEDSWRTGDLSFVEGWCSGICRDGRCVAE